MTSTLLTKPLYAHTCVNFYVLDLTSLYVTLILPSLRNLYMRDSTHLHVVQRIFARLNLDVLNSLFTHKFAIENA